MRILLTVAIGLRLSFFWHRGYPGDVDALIQFAEQVRTYGPHGLYQPPCCDGAVVYPPAFPYLLASVFAFTDIILGVTASLMSPLGDEAGGQLPSYAYGVVVVKSLALAGDFSLALLAWGVGRAVGHRAGWLSAGLVLLNPAFIYDGAIWGQVDSILGALLAATVVGVALGWWGSSGLLCAIAVLMKPQALVLVPFVLASATLIGGHLAVRKGLLVASATTLTILSPFLVTGRIQGVLESYLNHIGAYPELTVNAYNGWWFICHLATVACKGASPGSQTMNAATLISVGLFAAIYVIVLTLTNRRLNSNNAARFATKDPKERLTILLTGASVIYASLFMIGVEMHERYLYPAIALLAPIAPWCFRTLITYIIFSFSSTINMALVLPIGNISWVISELGFSPFVISVITIAGTALVWNLLAASELDGREVMYRMERNATVAFMVVLASGWVAVNATGVSDVGPWAIVGPAMSVGLCAAVALLIAASKPLIKERPSMSSHTRTKV